MQDLRSALQFVVLTIIARLLVYVIVRLIESVKPRSAHFIITSDTEPRRDTISEPGQGSSKIKLREGFRTNTTPKRYLVAGKQLVKIVGVNLTYYGVVLIQRLRNRYRKNKAKPSLKFLSEVCGLITALVSLLIIILNYFLK